MLTITGSDGKCIEQIINTSLTDFYLTNIDRLEKDLRRICRLKPHSQKVWKIALPLSLQSLNGR